MGKCNPRSSNGMCIYLWLTQQPMDAPLFRDHVPPVFGSKSGFNSAGRFGTDTLFTVPLLCFFPLFIPYLPSLPVFLHTVKPKTQPNGDASGIIYCYYYFDNNNLGVRKTAVSKKGGFGRYSVPKTRTRTHSPKPPFRKAALLFPLE